jgi:hypothetical protein
MTARGAVAYLIVPLRPDEARPAYGPASPRRPTIGRVLLGSDANKAGLVVLVPHVPDRFELIAP